MKLTLMGKLLAYHHLTLKLLRTFRQPASIKIQNYNLLNNYNKENYNLILKANNFLEAMRK